MSTVVVTPEQLADLEGSLSSSPVPLDSIVVTTADGRPWLLRSMPCEEVWAFSYRLGPDEPASRTRMLAADLPLPLVIMLGIPAREPRDSEAAS